MFLVGKIAHGGEGKGSRSACISVGGQGGYLRGGEATPREEDPRPASKLSSW